MRRFATVCAATAALALAGASVAAAAPSDLALALRLRPRLLFDSKERWRPIDVDRFLAEPGHVACPPLGSGAACAPLTSVGQLTPAVAYLDLRGTRESGSDATAPDLATCPKSLPTLRECDEQGRSVIYAHVVHAGRRVAIDYWWFLRYNAFTLDLHEGDWEGVTVIADAAGTKLLDVHFAAHSYVWRYDPDVPQIVGNRVKVYVARGDHAAYPRPCFHFCRTTDGTLPEGRSNGRISWVGNPAAGCRRACVRLLPQTAEGAPASWDAWNGLWGIPRSQLFGPPATPSAQHRFQRPFAARHSGRHHF
jgi:hypothetical protein